MSVTISAQTVLANDVAHRSQQRGQATSDPRGHRALGSVSSTMAPNASKFWKSSVMPPKRAPDGLCKLSQLVPAHVTGKDQADNNKRARNVDAFKRIIHHCVMKPYTRTDIWASIQANIACEADPPEDAD
eukprot:1179434-Pyramimonas_sp.AAC.1